MDKVWPYLISFGGAAFLTLLLTPLVREFHRRIGMVDKPDPRRINKKPIPRGGGVALVIGVLGSYLAFHFISGRQALQGISDVQFYRVAGLAVAVALLGLADDRFSLPPKIKLLGQIVISFLVWLWGGLGFADLWPWLPAVLDCILTVFWLVGAMNAFNLIDGLDGLASGLALIACIGMAGALFLAQNPQATLFYFAMAGGLVGFLRYNYNPASVFLGDSGSMFIGFTIAALPLCSHAPNSFLVSVGVPLLAMGVPIFDTSLAIVRRSIRRILYRSNPSGAGKVMTADSDHLHHRILRSVGLNQRKAAWTLYIIALAAVLTGLGGMYLESRSAGLWLAALAVAVVVIFRDAARIELFDAGRLLNNVAHTTSIASRRRIARLIVPILVVGDFILLSAVFFFVLTVLGFEVNRTTIRVALTIRVASTFLFLVLFRAYNTIWSRAVTSNYLRLFLACCLGAVAGSVALYYAPTVKTPEIRVVTVLYALLSFTALLGFRLVRAVVRDMFYAIDCSRLKGRKDVSRVLVYGAGIRYQAFRRELVRSTASNNRIIVGLLDDDLLLRNHYIGGIRVLGTLSQAPEIINAVNADAVVIACVVTDEWLEVVRKTLEPTGVTVTVFSFNERKLSNG